MLRREILRFVRADGGIDLFDPVLDRKYALTADEAATDSLPARLADAFLEEGPIAELIRNQWWARKRATVPAPPRMEPLAEAEWERAELLPDDVFGGAWLSGESWRRVAEDRAAGAYALPFRGMLASGFARELAAAHAGLSFDRMQVGITFADRHVCVPEDGGPIGRWLAVMASANFRTLMGAVLAATLPEKVTANAWLLRAGDEIKAHPVGTTYAATMSLGLNAGWTASDLGSIAFADAAPGEAAFAVRARWLPHLGDALAIARGPASWHWVEPPVRERRTLTGWWVEGGAGV